MSSHADLSAKSTTLVKKTARRDSMLIPPSTRAQTSKTEAAKQIDIKKIEDRATTSSNKNLEQSHELESKLQLSMMECDGLREVAERCQADLEQLRLFAEAERSSYESQIEELKMSAKDENPNLNALAVVLEPLDKVQ